MTAKEFNNKWREYLKEGHYGLAIDHPEVTKYLDKEFEKEIQTNPDFTYTQIKLKFGMSRVYAESSKAPEWETEIENIVFNK